MKKVCIIAITALVLSCATNSKVVRWPNDYSEQKSRILHSETLTNVFNDFLWTTPPLSAIEIKGEFIFNDIHYGFTVDGETLVLTSEGKSYQFIRETSNGTIYPNTQYLKPTTNIVHKWVPKTQVRVETVPVQKTRTVPVTSVGANGMTSTSYRTEFYTDFETHHITETNWVWEAATEYSYSIPDFSYFDVQLDNGERFLIYEMEESGKLKYYIQNPNYILCKEYNETFWGEKEINIIFLDTNANGIFFEDEDHMLFNTWNPYDPDSEYREVTHLMDNKWYFTGSLRTDMFISFQKNGESVELVYLNESFLQLEEEGSLTINNIADFKPEIFINGEKYKFKNGKPKRSEYGNFTLKIVNENHLDFFETYTIDSSNPNVVIDYQLPDPATHLEIIQIFSNNFFVTVSNADYTRTYYNTNEINLPFGKNTVSINVNGFNLTKEIKSNVMGRVVINFEEEIKTLLN